MRAGRTAWRPVQFLPDGQGRRATCVWQGTSLDAARDHVDGMLGDASEQQYFAVFEERAFVLPVRPAA